MNPDVWYVVYCLLGLLFASLSGDQSEQGSGRQESEGDGAGFWDINEGEKDIAVLFPIEIYTVQIESIDQKA